MELWVLWLIVIVLLTILEIVTINLVSIWFIISAIVSLFISFFNGSGILQFAVFVVLGVILMALTRPIMLKKINVSKSKTNSDRVIGMEGIVTIDINKNKVGEVKVDGKRWSAVADNKISVGSTVVVEKIDGVKLVVKKEGSGE